MSTSLAGVPAVQSDPWVPAARAAIADLAANALSSLCTIGDPEDGEDLPSGLAGALVPLVSGDLPPVQVGLFSAEDGCAGIARALLGFGPSDALSRADIVDAVNEVVNMLSGGVKARIPQYSSHAALGLPTFVHSPIEHSRGQVIRAVPARIGAIDTFVLILRNA